MSVVAADLLDRPASLLLLKDMYCVPGKVGNLGDINCHSEHKASVSLAFKPGHLKFTQGGKKTL